MLVMTAATPVDVAEARSFTPEQRADLLDAAALRLEVYGWYQNHMGLDGTPQCLVGALASELGGNRSICYYEASIVWFGEADPNGEGISRLTRWNDRPGRTAAEVIARLRERAAELRAGILVTEPPVVSAYPDNYTVFWNEDNCQPVQKLQILTEPVTKELVPA